MKFKLTIQQSVIEEKVIEVEAASLDEAWDVSVEYETEDYVFSHISDRWIEAVELIGD